MRQRTVIEEPAVSDSIDEGREDFERFDHAYDALQWRLSRGPHFGMAVEEGFIYRQAGNYRDIPFLTVLYVYDDDTVTFIALLVSAD